MLTLRVSFVILLLVPLTAASFIAPPSCIPNDKCSPAIRFALHLEEDHEQEYLIHLPDERDISAAPASIEIIGLKDQHDSFQPRNGKSHNGHAQPTLLHQQPPEVNGVPQMHANSKTQLELNGRTQPTTVRKLWQRRHARSIEEGVRQEKTTIEKSTQLYKLLSKFAPNRPGYFARTISGLINALADEAHGLEVDVDAREETPLWRKQVDAIHINFSRLGFAPLRMGGLDEAIRDFETQIPISRVEKLAEDLELAAVSSADEAFDRIDEDKSGALDQDEIARALSMAASTKDSEDEKLLEALATQLVELYDFNGDGVVDREEYQSLVADMAKLRQEEADRREKQLQGDEHTPGPFARVAKWVWSKEDDLRFKEESRIHEGQNSQLNVTDISRNEFDSPNELVNIDHDAAVDSVTKGGGSIVLQDLKLDLRQLIFGFVPFVKRITPGGPLILEPFTATATASFSKDDIMASRLLDAGLRRLVARALRRRVRSFRDLVDGAVFYGRTWNMASKSAPMVEVPELTSVEFDKENRLIMTGRAQVRTSPDAPFIENTFKLRTKIGTRRNGQCIRLVEPELAFVLECPQSWEQNIRMMFKTFGVGVLPRRPKPLYSYIPIYSPFKVDDNDGFDMGEDNRIKSIEIKDGALQFELSAVLRPGRFLGNHYLAFTIPQRTFIITMDRVREAIRAARQNNKTALAKKRQLAIDKRKRKGPNYFHVVAQSLCNQELIEDRFKFRLAGTAKKMVAIPPPLSGNKSFFSRFVDGYLGAGKDEKKSHERLTIAISDWFGRQGSNNTVANDEGGRSTDR